MRLYSVPAVAYASVIHIHVSVNRLDALVTDEMQRRCHLLVTYLSRVCNRCVPLFIAALWGSPHSSIGIESVSYKVGRACVQGRTGLAGDTGRICARDRVTKALGKESNNLLRHPAGRSWLFGREGRALVEVSVKAFAKV